MKTNFQLELDREIKSLNGLRPRLLLHSCCGPCSSYVLEYLTKYFDVTLFWCNPNIFPEEEFNKRLLNQRRLLSEMETLTPVDIVVEPWNHEDYLGKISGLEGEPEGGARCTECFRIRLERAARLAAGARFDYFCTTLTVSPHKDAERLNAIGQELGEKYGVKFLPSDFKKREGYKRSIELSARYDLYRQDYCGCEFSRGV